MKLTLESTPEILSMAPGIQYRVWLGVTDRGVKIEALITHIVAVPGQDESSLDELTLYPADWHSAFQNQEVFSLCEACKALADLGDASGHARTSARA